MKAIVGTAPEKLEFLDWPLPEPAVGQVRVKTLACGVCATDLEMIAGRPRVRPPYILGHEWSGVVDAIGPGVDAALAARLLGARCVAENVWSTGGEVGFEHPGGYGEYFVTEAARVQVLPRDFPAAPATLIEPLAVCVRGLRRARLASEERVLVIGDGPIGLLMVALLRAAGNGGRTFLSADPNDTELSTMTDDTRRVGKPALRCADGTRAPEIGLIGGRAIRLALAREFGATQTANYHEMKPDLAAGVKAAFGERFLSDCRLVIEAAGSGAAFHAALEFAAPGARLLVIGDYAEQRADFRLNRLLGRELELIGSNASAEAWPEAVRLACAERLPLERLITHVLPAARFQEAIALARDNRETIKVVLDWQG